MAPKKKSTRQTKLPLKRVPAPLTLERLVPLFEDMKDFVKSSIKASETVLRGEILAVRTELWKEMHALHDILKTELKSDIHSIEIKIDAIHCAITEHTKNIKVIETTVDDHEVRLTRVEQRVL